MIQCVMLYGNNQMTVSKYGGVFRLATELRKNNYTVQCVDISPFVAMKQIDELKNVLAKIIDSNTLWLGISTTFMYKIFDLPFYRMKETLSKRQETNPDIGKDFIEMLAFIRSLNPNIDIIAGGSRKFALEQYGIKIFEGYSDTELIEFTNWRAKKTSKINLSFHSTNIKGTEYKDFSSSSIEYIDSDIVDKNESLPIEISRGCIFKCKFCSFPLNGKAKGDWVKHTNVLKDEFNRNYEKYGITSYTFTDDTYNDSPDKIKSLYDEVFSKLDFKISFTTYLRLDLMMRNTDTIDYIVNSGLDSALFGIESLNSKSAKSIGKGVNPREQLDFVRTLKLNQCKDVMLASGFIIGLPHDTEETCQELEEFLFSDKNYLDSWFNAPLGIAPKEFFEHKYNYSDFDLSYKEYGYDVFEKTKTGLWDDVTWVNRNTNLTLEYCTSFNNALTERSNVSPKYKMGGFIYNWAKALGVPAIDLHNLSRAEIIKKHNLQEKIVTRQTNYINSLKNYYITNYDKNDT